MNDSETKLVEGIISRDELFDLDLTDSAVVSLIDSHQKEAEDHWYGKGWFLDKVYESNKSIWLPDHLKDEDFYDHELPYQDPRVFVSTETLIAQANSRIASPEVTPGSESDASLQLGKDLEVYAPAWARKQKVNLLQRQMTRGVFVNRHAYAFFWFDPHYGKKGEIKAEYVPGPEVLVDPDAKMGENPRYLIRKRRKTVQDLITMFPDKKDEIFKSLSIERAVRSQLGTKVGYVECWFTYHDDGTPHEAVAFKMGSVVLGKMSMPNWIENGKNFLPVPLKPFIPLNYLNLGDSYIDHTTLIEQAAAAQKLLDKRGRQAVEITDQSSGGLIFNSQMIQKKEAMKLTNHPKEKILVNGDVRAAVVRLAPADVSPAIINDKIDARNSINETFGTHAPTRGDNSGNQTLGQDQLLKQQDLTRNSELIRAIDQFFHDFYNYFLQMITVYYDEEHWMTVRGDDGKFDRIAMTSDKIEEGCEITVEPGSTLPIDKAALREIALKLAGMPTPMIDPLSLIEDLGMDKAQKRFKRLMQWITDPKSMVQTAEDENFDRMAYMDWIVLMAGETPKPRYTISDSYIKYFQKEMQKGSFLDPEVTTAKIRRGITKFVAKEIEILKQQLTLAESQLPTQTEMQQGNQQAVDQASQMAEIAKGQPQDPAAAAIQSAGPGGSSPQPSPIPAASTPTV